MVHAGFSIEQIMYDQGDFLLRFSRPLVTVSYAQSLDGSITARRGAPLALSSKEALEVTHRLRAAHDAILVGIGSVIADNPRLTVRHAAGSDPQPVVLDSQLRIPVDSVLLHSQPFPWIFCIKGNDARKCETLRKKGAKVFEVPPTSEGRVSLVAMLKVLGKQGIRSLMVEGGTAIITSFLTQSLVDQVVITVVPRLVGGLPAVERLLVDPADLDGGSNEAVMSYFPTLEKMEFIPVGPDLLVWGRLTR